MLGLVDDAANGKATDKGKLADRLARLLTEYDTDSGFAADATVTQVHSNERAEAPDHDPCGKSDLSGDRFEEEATKRIAEVFTWTVAEAAKQAQVSLEKDRATAEAIVSLLERLWGDVRHIKSEFANVRADVQSVTQRDSEIRSSLAAMEERVRQGEAELRGIRDQVSEVMASRSQSDEQARRLENRLTSIESGVTELGQDVVRPDNDLQSYARAVNELTTLYESLLHAQVFLQDRLAEQASAIEHLKSDASHRGSLMERLVGSLQGLEGRKERRFSVDREVKVVMVGQEETAISGCIVDASDSGLGLKLAAALPVGSKVRLDVGGVAVEGEVAHCSRRGAWYNAGLSSVCQPEEGVNEQAE